MPVTQARTIIELYDSHPCRCEVMGINADFRWHDGYCDGPCERTHEGAAMCYSEGSRYWGETELSWKLAEARLALAQEVS
jgi:hypothetical protein